MGNQGSSELDATIDKIIDLKNKPGLLKVELHKFVQQVPLEHQFDMRVDKKLFDILMNLITLELKQPNCPDIHIICMAIQRLFKVKGFYSAIPRCSIVPLLQALQHKDPTVVLSALNTLAWLLDCRCPTNDKKFDKATQETAAKQAFFESKGYEILITRVMIPYAKTQQHGVMAKVVDILALDLVDNCITTRFVGIQKLLQLLSPHIDLMLGLTQHQNLMTRCYGSILLQGFLLHSNLSTTQQLQSKVLEEGHLLWYILFAVDGANLPAGHPYTANGLYDKNLTELSRNLLGLLCAGNPAIVEISVQKTIPKPLQVSLESLNADSKTNTSLAARSKNEKELLKNTLWNNFQSGRMKRVNIHPQFQRLDQETREPHILWTVGTKAELCEQLMKEIDDLRLQKEGKGEGGVRWDYDGWEINYKSLNRYLRVGGFYISLLLPVLQDKNSTYMIELERIHMLLAALFQRSVVEDDPGWKLACLRVMSALYEKYGDQLTKDLEILPYFAWLIDPKHTLPIYRDHLLRMLQTLLKDHANVKRFVKSGGVAHLLFYISRVLTLPDQAPPSDGKKNKMKLVKKKRVHESSDEEDNDQEEKEEKDAPSGALSPSEGLKKDGTVSSSEDNEYSLKQNLLVGLPVPLGVPETAILCLNLLRSIQLAGAKMKRVMSEKDVVNTLARLLMSPVAGVKEDGIRLLLEILDHSTHLIPKLVTTGLFSFLVYGLRNGLSPAVLELVSKYHMKQDTSIVPAGESALSPFFPRALAEVLKTQGAEAFGQLFDAREAGGGNSDLIWSPALKKHLFEVMTRRLGTFRSLLVNDPFAEYRFSPPEPIRYPSLESELCMAGVFLRQLNETGGAAHLIENVKIPNPDELMGELIRSLNARRFAGIDLLNILTAQVIMIKVFPDLAEVISYPATAWDALFEILNNHNNEQEFPMIEKSAEIIHCLLSAHPSPAAGEEEDENVVAFVENKGVNMLGKTLEYFASLKINNILIQRILIALLHVVYDISARNPEAVSKEFSSSKKFLKKNILEFLGRKVTTEHPMLSVVTCKTLMALSLNEKFQTILLETGTILHLVDMAVFYRSAASEAASASSNNAQAAKGGMDEEKRVRLAASSVISVLAGYTTPAIHPEPNPQVQRVLSALLTPELAKSLQNPSGFVARCTELRPALQPLYKFIESELLAVNKSGEWPQKQWPFTPLNMKLGAIAKRPSVQSAHRGSASSFQTPARIVANDEEQAGGDDQQQYDENGNGVAEEGEVQYDEDGNPIEPLAEEEEIPDAYSANAAPKKLLSPGDKFQAKMENISSGIEDKMSNMGDALGGAFASLRSKAKNMVTPSKVAETKQNAAAAAAKAKGQVQAAGKAVAANPQVQRAASQAQAAAQKAQSAAAPTLNAAAKAAAPALAAGRQAASEIKQDATSLAKKAAIDAAPMIKQGQAQASAAAAKASAAASKASAAAEPKLAAAKSSASAFGAAAAGAAVAAFATAKAAATKKQPEPEPQAEYDEPEEPHDEEAVEATDSNSFYAAGASNEQDEQYEEDQQLDGHDQEQYDDQQQEAAGADQEQYEEDGAYEQQAEQGQADANGQFDEYVDEAQVDDNGVAYDQQDPENAGGDDGQEQYEQEEGEQHQDEEDAVRQ